MVNLMQSKVLRRAVLYLWGIGLCCLNVSMDFNHILYEIFVDTIAPMSVKQLRKISIIRIHYAFMW